MTVLPRYSPNIVILVFSQVSRVHGRHNYRWSEINSGHGC